MGGECVCCNYKKCMSGLDLHHLDPSQKDFGLGRVIANPKSWKKIVIELRKCILVCCRCHREIHEGITKIPLNATKFNEDFVEYKEVKRKKDICPICKKKEKWVHYKTCSNLCSAKLRGKVNWDNVDLNKMLIVDKLSYCEIGRRLNISDTAVRKRAKKMKII